MDLKVIILAAGQGTRMKSPYPKVLHPIGGKPMLAHVIDAAQTLDPASVIVIHGEDGERLKTAIPNKDLIWVPQISAAGTGAAVQSALPCLSAEDRVLVLLGDTPLVSTELLKDFLSLPPETLSLITVKLPDPTGLGRIVRDTSGSLLGIVEEKDATEEERKIAEVNSGMFLLPAALLQRYLPELNADNAQQEYYLTDIIKMAAEDSLPMGTKLLTDPVMAQGVNNKLQWKMLERTFQVRNAQSLLSQGVAIADPARLDVRGDLHVGEHVEVDIDVIFEGSNTLGDGAAIGAFCYLKDCQVGAGVVIHPHSHLVGVTLEAGATVGPFARLRPGTVLGKGAKVGNFVEMKKATLGANSKAGHLSYLGDATIAEDVNIGAGTICCNYDGYNKYATEIKAGAFVGSGTQLVAPVTVGAGATVAAGTTLTKDAPSDALTLRRAEQRIIANWKRKEKRKET